MTIAGEPRNARTSHEPRATRGQRAGKHRRAQDHRPAQEQQSARSGYLLLVSAVLLCLGCTELTKPKDTQQITFRPRAPAPEVRVEPVPQGPSEPQAPPKAPEKTEIAHILIAYKGALSAGPKVTRSKEQASVLAKRLRNRAKFEAFAALAKIYSDDVETKNTGGDLGLLSEEELADLGKAAFELAPGGVDVVETDFGFHIIRRAL